jgi:hypothetical protein
MLGFFGSRDMTSLAFFEVSIVIPKSAQYLSTLQSEIKALITVL